MSVSKFKKMSRWDKNVQYAYPSNDSSPDPPPSHSPTASPPWSNAPDSEPRPQRGDSAQGHETARTLHLFAPGRDLARGSAASCGWTSVAACWLRCRMMRGSSRVSIWGHVPMERGVWGGGWVGRTLLEVVRWVVREMGCGGCRSSKMRGGALW